MRLVLLLVVAALVYDAVANDSAYTKKAWSDLVALFDNEPATSEGI